MKLRQFFLSKKKPLAMILGVSMFFLAAAVSAPSLAWFIEIQDKANTQNMSGVIHGAYFGGSGTQQDPYTISQPKQIYYFNWLQDIGYFNIKTSNQDLTQIYFKLTDDIDMSGFVLPPAGTTRFPFVGSFDGDGHTISNLTITNVYSDLTDPVTQSLDKQSMGTAGGHLKTLNNNDCEIVGFFGVIGDSDGELSTDHQTGYLLDDGKQNYAYQNATNYVVATNVVKNVAFKNLTVDSHTPKTLSGLAAGFVNGTMSGVAVDDSSLSFSNTNQAALTTFTNNLSDYSLVGYAAPQFRGNVQKAEAHAIAPTVENPNSAQGGDQWGGSIDMRTMYQNVLATERNTTTRVQYATTGKVYQYLSGETLESLGDYTDLPASATGRTNTVFYDGVTIDDADSYEEVFTLDTAEKGDTTGYCGTWVHDEGNDVKTRLILSSDGSGSFDGVSFTWNLNTHAINGFGCYDQGGTVTLSAGRITLSLSDAQKQTASMTINRRYNDSSNLTSENEFTNYMYLYGGSDDQSFDDAPDCTITRYVERNDAAITDRGGNCLSVSARNNTYTISSVSIDDSPTRWTYTNDHYLTTMVNGYAVYLGCSGTTLTANRTLRTVWNYDSASQVLSCLISGTKYTLVNQSGWKLTSDKAVTIHDDTRDLYVNFDYSYVAGHDSSNATTWMFDSANGRYCPTEYGSYYLNCYDPSSYPFIVYNSGNYPYRLNGSSTQATGTGSFYASVSSYYSGSTKYYAYWTGSEWSAKTGSGDTFTIAEAEYQSCSFLYYFSRSSTEKATYSTKDTYFPLTWEDSVGNGSTVPTEVSDRNTGYVISGANYSTDDYRGDIRVSWYSMSSLSAAFNTSSSSYSYSGPQNMEIVTRTYAEQENGTYIDKGWTRISDEDNANNGSVNSTLRSSFASKMDYRSDLKLEKYWNAKKGLKAMFSADTGRAYGLHFMNAAISANHTISAPYAKINGEAYTNYELPEDCIDFNLASSGFVNFFAGSYFSGNNTFFSLNEIDRDNNGAINAIHQISAIYLNSDSNTNEDQPYYYTYTGGGHSATGSQGAQVFDMAWVMSPNMVNNALYYFEIPVNFGEYALGSVSGKNGAYLLYLDIGASTTNYKAVTITELIQGEGKSLVYPLGVDFVELTSVVFAKDMNLGGLTAAIIVPAQSTGVQHYKYDEDNEGGSLVVAPPQGKSFTGTLEASFVAPNVTAAGFTSTDCTGLTASSMRIDRVTSETYDPWTYTVTQQIDSEYTLSGIPGTTLQLYAGGAGNANWSVQSGTDATVNNTGLVTFTGSGEVVIKSTVNVVTNNVTEYHGPEAVEASEDSAGGISYVITNGEASVSWSYDAYTKTYTVRVYSTVGATIAVTKPAEGYTIVITDGTNSTPITSASQTTTVNIAANA